jgi:site-specific DNA recombinase
MTPSHGKPVGIYRRISDDREGLELGVQRQEEDLRAAADRAGDTIVDVYCDNDTGASTRSRKRRPEYERLIADATAGRITKIWAYTSSRLTRRPLEHEAQIQLAEKYGTEFAYIRSPSVDLNTANGRMIARMLAAKDANESEETAERITRAFRQKRERGEHLGGGRHFGWDTDGVTPVPAEYAAISQGSDDVLTGIATYTIMRDWNADGLLTSRGNPWSLVTVRQVLVRPRNAGLIVHYGEIVGRYPWYEHAPVSEDVWLAVRAVLTDPERLTAPGNKPVWLGSGLYVCWGCESAHLSVGVSAGSRGTGHRLYRCQKQVSPLPGRHHVARQALALDAYVEELVVARLCRPDAVDLMRDERPPVDLAALRAEQVSIRAAMVELDDDRDVGRIDRARWLRRNERLKDRLVAVGTALEPAGRTNPFTGVVNADDPAVVWYGTLPDRSDGLSLEHRRAIVDRLVTVTVLPVRAKRGPFDPDRIDVVRKA